MKNLILALLLIAVSGSLFGQVKKTKTETGIPFPNDNIQAILFIGKTLDNLDVWPQYQYQGAHMKLRQEMRNGKMQVGASGIFIFSNVEDKKVSIKDKRFGAGLSMALSSSKSWTDIDIQYQRLERTMDIDGGKIALEERINFIDFSTIIDLRRKFVNNFSLSGWKIYAEYIYPLNGQRLYMKGPIGKKEAVTNIKSLYLKVEPTWYNKQLNDDLALTSFFVIGYDHQSWNRSDNYTLGAGIRLYAKDVEFINIFATNRFRPHSSEGEPSLNGSINFIPLFKLL